MGECTKLNYDAYEKQLKRYVVVHVKFIVGVFIALLAFLAFAYTFGTAFWMNLSEDTRGVIMLVFCGGFMGFFFVMLLYLHKRLNLSCPSCEALLLLGEGPAPFNSFISTFGRCPECTHLLFDPLPDQFIPPIQVETPKRTLCDTESPFPLSQYDFDHLLDMTNVIIKKQVRRMYFIIAYLFIIAIPMSLWARHLLFSIDMEGAMDQQTINAHWDSVVIFWCVAILLLFAVIFINRRLLKPVTSKSLICTKCENHLSPYLNIVRTFRKCLYCNEALIVDVVEKLP